MRSLNDSVTEIIAGKFTAATHVSLRITGASNTIGATELTPGTHRICSNVDSYILQGKGAIEVTVANGVFLPARRVEYVPVESGGNTNIAAIVETGNESYLSVTRCEK